MRKVILNLVLFTMVLSVMIGGCSDTNEPDKVVTEYGKLAVLVTPDLTPWGFVDAKGGQHVGAGSDTLSNIPIGKGMFEWLPVNGWQRPQDAPFAVTIVANQMFTVTGVYTEDQIFSVSQPAAGSSYYTGLDDLDIMWGLGKDYKGKEVEFVRLSLFKGDTEVALIAAQSPNSGSFLGWEIPDDLVSAMDYQVLVGLGDEGEFSSAAFSISTPIIITAPVEGHVWNSGDNVAVTWSHGSASMVSIKLVSDSGSETILAQDTDNDGLLGWTVPESIATGVYHVVIEQDSREFSGDEFNIEGTCPPFAFTTPNAETIWTQLQENALIEWTGGCPDVDIRLEFYQGESKVWDITFATENSGYFVWDEVPNVNLGNAYKVKISQNDLVTFSEFFTIAASCSDLVFSPPSGENSWRIDDSEFAIHWSGGCENETTNLDLYQNDEFISFLQLAPANEHDSIVYELPESVQPGDGFKFKATQRAIETYSVEFEIADCQQLVFTEPTSITVWRLDSVDRVVSWEAGCSNEDVRLELVQGSNVWLIVESVENNYAFVVPSLPSGLAPATDYRMKATQGDRVTLSPEFEIENCPSISILTPNSGSIWSQGQEDVSISWSGGCPSFDVEIQLMKGGSVVETLGTHPNTGSFNEYDVPADLTPGIDYQIAVFSGVSTYHSESFEVLRVCDPLAITAPAAGITWNYGAQVSVLWSGGCMGGGDVVTVELYRDGALERVMAENIINEGSLNNYLVPADLPESSNYQVKVFQGEMFDFSDFFIVAPVCPDLVFIYPDGMNGWEIDSPDFSVQWSGGCVGEITTLDIYQNGEFVSFLQDVPAGITNPVLSELPAIIEPGTGFQLKTTQMDIETYSAEFEIADCQQIVFTEPTSVTTWRVDSVNMDIAWDGGCRNENVRLELVQGTVTAWVIAESVENDQSYVVPALPSELDPATNYQVKLIQGEQVAFSPEFAIEDCPMISISNPNSATIWDQGQQNVPIEWSGGCPDYDVELQLWKGSSLVGTLGVVQNTGSFNDYDVPVDLTPGIDYRILILSGGSTLYSANFEVRQVCDPLLVTNPYSGTTWNYGDEVSVQWSGGCVGPGDAVTIELYLGGNLERLIAVDTVNDGSFSNYIVPSDIPESSNYQVKISQDDLYHYSSYFDIGPVCPDLMFISPGGSNGWEIDSPSFIALWMGGCSGEITTLDIYQDGEFVTFFNEVPAGIFNPSFTELPSIIEPGTGFQLKATQLDIETYSAEFAIEDCQQIIFTEPTSYTTWQVDSVDMDITWDGGCRNENVRLELVQGSTVVWVIAESVENDHAYVVPALPGGLEPATNYRVKMVQGDWTAFSPEFEIEGCSNISISTPSSSTIWNQGQQNVAIGWSGGCLGYDVEIQLLKSGSFVGTLGIVANWGSYNEYDVPADLTPGTDYQVALISHGITFYSDNFEVRRVCDPLLMTNPTSGTIWHAGEPESVQWSGGCTEPGDVVTLELYRGGTLQSTMAYNTENNGSLSSYLVPSDTPPSSDYRVKVIQDDLFDYSDYFTIEEICPYLEITEPDFSTTWIQGEIGQVRWNGGCPGENVRIELHRYSILDRVISSSTPNDGALNYSVSTSLESGPKYQIKIIQESSGLVGMSPFFFIDEPFQPLAFITPTAGTIWHWGDTVTTTWVGGDPDQNVALEIWVAGEFWNIFSASTPNDGSASFDLPAHFVTYTNVQLRIIQGGDSAMTGVFTVSP